MLLVFRCHANSRHTPGSPGEGATPTKGLKCNPGNWSLKWANHEIDIVKTLVFGTLSVLLMLIFRSTVSNTINTSFVERHNGTDRNQNARKACKTLRFSKVAGLFQAIAKRFSSTYLCALTRVGS
jgi:hypothetical protein